MADQPTIEALAAYAGQLSEAAAQARAASEKQHQIINGDAQTDILTESGLVPSVAKQAVLAQEKVTSALVEVASQMAGAMTYGTIAAGLAGTVNGGFFSVPSPESLEYLILYENVAGVAVPRKRYPSAEAVESKIPSFVPEPVYVPLVSDAADNVAVWLVDGKFDAFGVGPNIRDSIGVNETVPYADNRVPVLSDESGNVALWLDEGRLEAIGLGPRLRAEVTGLVSSYVAAAPADQAELLTTRGKSLWLYQAKKALINSGVPAKMKVMFIGDSWSDLETIPNKMSSILATKNTKLGYGWISSLLNRMTDGATAVRNGWTAYDAASALVEPSYGCSFDGAAITTTGVTANLNISGVVTTSFSIYYRGGTGTFRYRIDGGAWTPVTGGADGVMQKVAVTGLSDAAHVLDIDTVGNMGNVTLYGFYATRGTSGYEVLKCGRGGLDGREALRFVNYIPQYAADLEADLLIISLGTNDYVSGNLQGFIDGLTGLITKHREGRPDIGIIVVCPPDSNGVASIPLTTIRKYGQQVAVSLGCEYADVHSVFPVYAKSNALGLWNDDLHLSSSGADILCRHIYNNFMV